jgi:hypothetical protein
MKFAIRFHFPGMDGVTYAGDYKGALGWAPTLKTAIIWTNRETAERILENGYGSMAAYGEVVEV